MSFRFNKQLTWIIALVFITFAAANAMAETRGVDVETMAKNVTDFDPNNFQNPTGDTIKIGVMNYFSGSGAGNGELYWPIITWVVHDINKRGGIFVDGKKKKIQIIKGDHQGKPAICKKEAEKLCLEEKVDVLWGSSGSHLAAIMSQVAGKYKVIHNNCAGTSDSLLTGKNFNIYTFRTCVTTSMFGWAMAYYYSKRPEKKFYILCQDYMYGHDIANAFKAGLKAYKPDHIIAGESYHPLFLKDFAPYITKIQGSGAEVLYTGDWIPDGENLVKTAKDLALNIPIANLYADMPYMLESIGGPAGRGMVNGNEYMISVDTPENNKFVQIWHEQWKRWDKPYNTPLYKWPMTVIGGQVNMAYWLFDVIERAGTTKAEKIIEVWEGDEYKATTGMVKMRACDHEAIKDMFVSEFIFPNKWQENGASFGNTVTIPAKYCTHPIPQDLDRCNK